LDEFPDVLTFSGHRFSIGTENYNAELNILRIEQIGVNVAIRKNK